MKAKNNNANQADQKTPIDGEGRSEGYPFYPDNDDIYIKYKEDKKINPEDLTKKNINVARKTERNLPDDDLDIPGSELVLQLVNW